MFKNLLKKGKIKVMLFVAAVMTMLTSAVAFAGEPTSAPVDFSPITDSLASSFNVGLIATIIGLILATGMTFFIFWWGARKLVKAIQQAFSKGKVSV